MQDEDSYDDRDEDEDEKDDDDDRLDTNQRIENQKVEDDSDDDEVLRPPNAQQNDPNPVLNTDDPTGTKYKPYQFENITTEANALTIDQKTYHRFSFGDRFYKNC